MPGFAKSPRASRAASAGSFTVGRNVEDLERRAGAHAFGVRAAAERPLLLPRELCLDGKDAGDDVGDVVPVRSGSLRSNSIYSVIQSRTGVSALSMRSTVSRPSVNQASTGSSTARAPGSRSEA